MKKILLDEEEMPDKWYNLQSEIELPPPLNPITLEPVKASDLEKIFPKELVRQEISKEKWIRIPQEVGDIYKIWRPTPLYRAEKLEEFLKTPAKIYYKWEGTSPPGSHKPNTAVAQAYYNSKEGIERLTTETGAGQWGSALSFACSFFGLKCAVYMVKCSFEQKPYRRILMETWGAEVIASPSNRTEFGRKVLKEEPDNSGSLGIAISEAIEDAITHEDTKYSLGSVLNHVLLHQTIIGLELKKQFEKIDLYPDIICGCVGGGSNFSGGIFPFVPDKINGREIRFIACEPTACPSLTRGIYTYDHGDTARITPLLKMFTLGHAFIPPAIHAGGLRYHGDAPLLCKIVNDGVVEKRAYSQNEVFEAAKIFAKTEGFLIAPESAHGLKGAIDEALKCKKEKEEKIICFLNSGHGAFDLSAYELFNKGLLQNHELSDEEIGKALKKSNISIEK
ncbi:MAG: TrpB-like pyridoxal phosphate-dependent enzyme [Candidatus Thermoplasmatota archaeon]